MSLEELKVAIQAKSIIKLKKINAKDISVVDFVKYLSEADDTIFETLCDMSKKYDSDVLLKVVIDLNNEELMENILDTHDAFIYEDLMRYAAKKGRLTMAKIMYVFMYSEYDLVKMIKHILKTYEFKYEPTPYSIDSVVIAIYKNHCDYVKKAVTRIKPNFWDNFCIRFACELGRIGIIKVLLRSDSVDPLVCNIGYLVKKARKSKNNDEYNIISELLKHPQVSVNDVDHLTKYNKICTIEKIFNLGNKKVISYFEKKIDSIFYIDNNVIALAVKYGIVNRDNVNTDVTEEPLCYLSDNRDEIKKAIDDYIPHKIKYFPRSYVNNLDPIDIFELAIENDDPSLIEDLGSYKLFLSTKYLVKSFNKCKENMIEFISDNVWDEYDIEELYDEAQNRDVAALMVYMVENNYVKVTFYDLLEEAICDENYPLIEIILADHFDDIDIDHHKNLFGIYDKDEMCDILNKHMNPDEIKAKVDAHY
jgi:hypothetical protein